MTIQSMQKILMAVAMTVLAALGAASADADDAHKAKRVDMKFAGTLLLNLEQQQFSSGMPNGTGFIGVARAKAVGNLGWADVSAATKAEPVPGFPEYDARCPAGFLKVAEITDNNLVFTFFDLSLLYGDGTGVVCFEFDENFLPIDRFVSVQGEWLGGTKRFANVEGEFSLVSEELVEISPNTQFSAESGRITGFLRRP